MSLPKIKKGSIACQLIFAFGQLKKLFQFSEIYINAVKVFTGSLPQKAKSLDY